MPFRKSVLEQGRGIARLSVYHVGSDHFHTKRCFQQQDRQKHCVWLWCLLTICILLYLIQCLSISWYPSCLLNTTNKSTNKLVLSLFAYKKVLMLNKYVNWLKFMNLGVETRCDTTFKIYSDYPSYLSRNIRFKIWLLFVKKLNQFTGHEKPSSFFSISIPHQSWDLAMCVS